MIRWLKNRKFFNKVPLAKEITYLYKKQKSKIIKRLNEFKCLWRRKDDEKLLAELCFCLLTPQSKAKSCWKSVENLVSKGLLLKGDKNQILQELDGVRFKYKKAEYIVQARKIFSEIKQTIKNSRNVSDLRKWLVKNVHGLGYKEASHFLRNVGLGDDFAILDRHVLKNLKKFRIVEKIPNHITGRKYIEIEEKVKLFSKKINIPLSHLDLLFWSKETNEIFK